jgi:hypothetical protein
MRWKLTRNVNDALLGVKVQGLVVGFNSIESFGIMVDTTLFKPPQRSHINASTLTLSK